MKIAVLALGSRGDVQPAIALAARLAREAEVVFIAPRDFAALSAGRGFAFHPIPIDAGAEIHSPEAEQFFRDGGLAGMIRWSRAAAEKAVDIVFPAILAGGEGAELVVATGLMDYYGAALADKLGVACVHAYWAPMVPAADFVFAASEQAPPKLPGFANRAMYTVFEQALWMALRPALKRAYLANGVKAPPFFSPSRLGRNRGETVLLAYSEKVLPRSREWPANWDVTGWWYLDDGANWTPPPDLQRFLETGPPPVYIGFGSMAFLDSEKSFAAVVGALRKTGARAIVGAGWGGLRPQDLPENACLIDEAPHDWLFPRMAAIVHHGGAGATGAAVRAGRPSVVTPFIVDQFAWGRQLHAQGLAPAPLPHHALTADALAAALDAALGDAAMRRRAEEIGARVRAEDGLARAAEIVLGAAK